MQYNTMKNFNHLLEKGDIVECPSCGAYNAYAWQDVNMDCNTGVRLINDDGYKDGGEPYTDEEILTAWPDVYHMPTCSCFDYSCGKCKCYFTKVDSPINAEVYTHVPVSYTPDDLINRKQEILQSHNWKYLTSARAKLLLKGENHE